MTVKRNFIEGILFWVTLNCFMLYCANTYAFGPQGHKMVADIATRHLTPDAHQQLLKMTQGKGLSSLATWADHIRKQDKWRHTAPWHYINIDDNQTWQTVERSSKGDVITALEHFEAVLKEQTSNQEQRWQALAFYIHFVADIHQPLHVGYAHDKGGNAVNIIFDGKLSNLHRVWDSQLLSHLSKDEYNQLINHIGSSDIQQWQGKSYYEWADESKTLRQQAYQFQASTSNKAQLSEAYIANNKKVVSMRIQQAGIRLAEKLNLLLQNAD